MVDLMRITISIHKMAVANALSRLVELDGQYLKPHAHNIEKAAIASLFAGGHYVTGRLVNSIRVEEVRGAGLIGSVQGYDIVAGADDPWPDAPTPSEVYASYGEYGTDNREAWLYMTGSVLREQPKMIGSLRQLVGSL